MQLRIDERAMGRSPCCDNARVKRGAWSQEEDAILRSFVQRFGNGGNWIALPQKAGLKRCGKSCHLRWLNYLRRELRHGGFTDEEDNLILSLYGDIVRKWSVIASRLPGRTDNDVKNYWNTRLKKRLLAAAKREGTPPPPPLPPPPFVAAAAESQPQDDRPLPPPPLTPSANLDTSIADTSTRRGSFTASGTSPAVSSSSSWCNGWPPPMDVQDTALLSESISRR